ncbi:MAG: hypothetical protein ISS71_04330, partial [Phycisphaerae bacterium]|nr:hypothetical protein [Phycisphaerae bacterium]
MIPIPQYLLDVFQWLVRSSFHASILLAMILLVRAVVKGKFRFRMVYWLWMVLLLRLIWPLNLQTTFSVFNLIPKKITPEQYLSAQTAEEGPSNQDTIGLRQSEPVISDTDASSDGILVATNDAVNNTTAAPAVTFNDPMSFWCTVWLIGAEGLAAWVLFNNFRLWSIIKRERLITRQEILELLEDCKSQLGLQTVIGIVETDKVKTPCLFGYLRPRLLLPGGILDEMEQRELRYVFLHELGHLKRHDILIGWLMAVVQVLHWFNPAVWFAMAQISRDRELACDELALSSLKDGESKEYGATILTFLERFARQQRLPAMAGIAENQSLLKRRITMIAQFKNKKISWIPVIAIILLLLATTFTSAQADSDPNTAKEPSKTETANTSPSKPEMLVLDDGNSAGKRSIAGSGHAVFFETEKKSELVAVMLYGSRYGYDQPPKEKFHVWLCDMDQQVIEDFEFPYSTFKKGDPKWVKMRVKATQLPDRFYICVGFNAEQTKGVYVHYDGAASGNSYKGLPKDGFSEFEEGDWMIRAVVRPMGGNGASSSSVSSGNLQSMIDAAETGATVEIPAGTYEESIKVDKSLILKGASRDECI